MTKTIEISDEAYEILRYHMKMAETYLDEIPAEMDELFASAGDVWFIESEEMKAVLQTIQKRVGGCYR